MFLIKIIYVQSQTYLYPHILSAGWDDPNRVCVVTDNQAVYDRHRKKRRGKSGHCDDIWDMIWPLHDILVAAGWFITLLKVRTHVDSLASPWPYSLHRANSAADLYGRAQQMCNLRKLTGHSLITMILGLININFLINIDCSTALDRRSWLEFGNSHFKKSYKLAIQCMCTLVYSDSVR